VPQSRKDKNNFAHPRILLDFGQVTPYSLEHFERHTGAALGIHIPPLELLVSEAA
jgi:hypothetical protein